MSLSGAHAEDGRTTDLSLCGFIPAGEFTPRSSKRLLERWSNPKGEEGTVIEMVSANHLPQGDPMFLERGLQLSVWGIVPENGKRVPEAIDAEVLFEPFHSNRFTAWRFRNHKTRSVNAPNRVNVPVDPTLGVNLSISMRWNKFSEKGERMSIHLDLGANPLAPKLHRGLYFIPLGRTGRWDLIKLENGGGGSAVENPLLLLETNYGNQSNNPLA